MFTLAVGTLFRCGRVGGGRSSSSSSRNRCNFFTPAAVSVVRHGFMEFTRKMHVFQLKRQRIGYHRSAFQGVELFYVSKMQMNLF